MCTSPSDMDIVPFDIVQQVERSLITGNLSMFREIVSHYRFDINAHVVDEPENGIRMNILHLVANWLPVSAKEYLTMERYREFLNVLAKCNGFDVDARASKSRLMFNVTASQIAVQRRNKSLLAVLIQFDCDLLICNSYGMTAEDYAKSSEDESLIEMVKNGIFRAIELQRKKYDHQEWYHAVKVPVIPYENLTGSKNSYESSDFCPFDEKLTIMATNTETIDDFSSEGSVRSQISSIDFEIEPELYESNNFAECHNNLRPHSQTSSVGTTTTIYHDPEGIELIEEKSRPMITPLNDTSLNASSTDLNHDDSQGSNKTIDSMILRMSDDQLFEKLHDRGFETGPINDGTRKYYQKKYHLLINEDSDSQKIHEIEEENIPKMSNFNIPFEMIRNKKFPFKKAIELEETLVKLFNSFESNEKQTHFVYLLLDPNITENIPIRINRINESASVEDLLGGIINDARLFYRFVSAIFYVGKGQSNRPYQHLVDALRAKANPHKKPTAKTQKIWTIWDQGRGPVSLHFYTGITSDEAFTREALLIDTINLFNLTNQISGSYRRILPFNQQEKNILGTYFLFKFFIFYLLNGERQMKIPQ